MRFLIIAAGSHGDIHPFIAVTRELLSRGHDADFLVHPAFHPDLRAAGVNPLPLTPELDLHAILRNPDLMRGLRGSRLVLDMVLDSITPLCHTLEQTLQERRYDGVLAHHICIGTRWICQRHQAPLALGVLAPIAWLSRSAPVPPLQRTPPRARPGKGWAGLFPGGWHASLARAALPLLLPLALTFTDRRINPIRASLGFAPLPHNLLKDSHSGEANLALWSPSLRPPQPDDPPTGVVCGFPFFDTPDPTASLDPRLEDFLAAGPPPIVFCLGTAASHSAGDFHTLATRAAQRINRRAILLVGKGVPPPCPRDSLPSTIIAAEYAPFSLLLPRAAVVVHHGGIGSTAQTLRAGKPALVIPHAHDQFNNALLLHRRGVARILPRARVTVPRLARHLGALLHDDACLRAAHALARSIASESGAAVAADHLERIAREGTSSSATRQNLIS